MRTLCVEIVPSYLRGVIVDDDGRALSDRRRVELRRGSSPGAMLDRLEELVADLNATLQEQGDGATFDRVSAAFGGIVIDGGIVTSPGFTEEWQGLRVTGALEFRLGVPARAASDAAVMGLGVIDGHGVEMALTFGARLGTAIFVDGHAVSALDFGSHPFSEAETYDDRLGNTARKRIGNAKWNRRIIASLDQLGPIFNYRRVHLGGTNLDKIDPSLLPEDARLADASSALRGGLRLWSDPPR